jgi:hypothetical protein
LKLFFTLDAGITLKEAPSSHQYLHFTYLVCSGFLLCVVLIYLFWFRKVLEVGGGLTITGVSLLQHPLFMVVLGCF